MTLMAMAHTVSAMLAIAMGGIVVARPKGDRFHALMGRLYVASMLTLNVTALSIYRLYGKFGPFHWLALSSLVSVFLALFFVLRKKPQNWMILHGETMSWSYVGLLAAAVAEISVRVLAYPFDFTVATSSFLVIAIGGTIVWKKMRRLQASQHPAAPKPR